jgi:hypothetical protein
MESGAGVVPVTDEVRSGEEVTFGDKEPGVGVEPVLGDTGLDDAGSEVVGVDDEPALVDLCVVEVPDVVVVVPPLADSVLVGGEWRCSDPSEPEEPDPLPDVVPGDDGAEVELLEDDGELPVVGLACAIPDPLASAALTPRVTAPAPSHRYASGRG